MDRRPRLQAPSMAPASPINGMQGPLAWWAEDFGRGRGVEARAAKVMLHVCQLQRSGVSAEAPGRVSDTDAQSSWPLVKVR